MGWEKKFPILKDYKDIIDVKEYTEKVSMITRELSERYNLSTLDSMLVTKDILYQEYLRMRREEEEKRKIEKENKKKKKESSI